MSPVGAERLQAEPGLTQNGCPHVGCRPEAVAAAEALVKERIREEYREAWDQMSRRRLWSICPHLMLLTARDLLPPEHLLDGFSLFESPQGRPTHHPPSEA